jgi:histidinol dehydrogenase
VPLLPRRAILEKSLQQYGAILVVPDLGTAIDFANELAPSTLSCASRMLTSNRRSQRSAMPVRFSSATTARTAR